MPPLVGSKVGWWMGLVGLDSWVRCSWEAYVWIPPSTYWVLGDQLFIISSEDGGWGEANHIIITSNSSWSTHHMWKHFSCNAIECRIFITTHEKAKTVTDIAGLQIALYLLLHQLCKTFNISIRNSPNFKICFGDNSHVTLPPAPSTPLPIFNGWSLK